MMAAAEADASAERPTISVVMANYNGSAYLADAIRSVQNQTLNNLELIVVDDASSDNSVDIVRSLQSSDPRIRLLQGPRNAGPAAARNRAITVAAGEWTAIMDSDDTMHPERLARLVAAAAADEADLVADDIALFSDDARPSRRLLRGRWSRSPFWVDITEYVRLNALYAAGPALGYLKPLIRTAILREYEAPYDESLRLAEDYHLVLRLLHDGRAMRVYPLPLYYYRRHATSTSHRLSEAALIALKTADLRFFQGLSPNHKRLRRAMLTKIRSTETALAYEKLLTSLRKRAWLSAFAIACARPRAAMLLRLPLGVRVGRLLRDCLGQTQRRPLTPAAAGQSAAPMSRRQ